MFIMHILKAWKTWAFSALRSDPCLCSLAPTDWFSDYRCSKETYHPSQNYDMHFLLFHRIFLCAGQQGSWDIGVLELHALGYTPEMLWAIDRGQNYIQESREAEKCTNIFWGILISNHCVTKVLQFQKTALSKYFCSSFGLGVESVLTIDLYPVSWTMTFNSQVHA